jgi:hypothetical protein
MSWVERVHHLTFVVALLALLALRTWHMRDRRSRRPDVHLAGIGGHDPLPAGIPRAGFARDEMEAGGRLRLFGQHNMAICRFFLESDGSDGTRTRDLRRDRPLRARPAQPARARNYLLEQGFPGQANPLCPATTGCRPAGPVWYVCGRGDACFDNSADVWRGAGLAASAGRAAGRGAASDPGDDRV